MAKGEILATSKFYVQFDGLEDLVMKSCTGPKITLESAGDTTSYGVSKGGKSVIQATVTGVTNGTITVVYVSSVSDNRLMKWHQDSHSESILGGGSANKGALKTGSIILYNQGGDEAARWNITGVMPKTYKSSKFDPSSKELATETVEFVYHSIHRVK